MQIRKGMTPEEVDAFVEESLSAMTLSEKAGCMTGRYPLWSMMVDFMVFKHYNRVPYPTYPVKRLGIPDMRFSDGPRGVVMHQSTCFPVSMARGASFDPELEERIGSAIGKEIRAQGGNYYGGVCINLLRHPAWGRAQETYGEDPYLLGEMGAALTRGVQRHNVMACIKHYAANSVENTRFSINVKMSPRTLREVYLPHFKRCIDDGAASVMGAYNLVNDDHCCESELLLTQVLRNEWDFQGFTISDFVNGIYDTKKAVEAGLDIEMPSPSKYGRRLVKMVWEGKISQDVIDRSVRRILRTIVKFTAAPDPQTYDRKVVVCDEHVKLAQEAAEKSMVLLKNEGVLPLVVGSLHKVALVGKLAAVKNIGDHGSSMVHPPHIVTLLDGMKAALPNATIEFYDGQDMAAASAAARQADAVILVAGYEHKDEGEFVGLGTKIGGDRISIRLKPEESAMIKTIAPLNPHSVVALVGGSAIIMEEWKDAAPAILMSFYSGMEGGTALARILLGQVNPSGRLPFSIAKDETDYPFFDRTATQIEYGYYHGYTLFDKQGIQPAFPFGFGLGYSQFTYSDVAVAVAGQQAEVSVRVKNLGERAGATVVQLYMGCPAAEIDRPVKLLRGFRKVELQPGEERRVTLPVAAKDLAVYREETKDWITEDKEWVAMVGSSSQASDLQEVAFHFA